MPRQRVLRPALCSISGAPLAHIVDLADLVHGALVILGRRGDHTLGAPITFVAKQGVHLVKGDALGLREEEEGPNCSRQHPTSEEEPDAIVKRFEDVRQSFRDDELNHPLGEGGPSAGKGTKGAGEDLGRDDPRDTVETKRPAREVSSQQRPVVLESQDRKGGGEALTKRNKS